MNGVVPGFGITALALNAASSKQKSTPCAPLIRIPGHVRLLGAFLIFAEQYIRGKGVKENLYFSSVLMQLVWCRILDK